MTTQTHILAKDAALEDSIATFQRALLNANFTIVEQSWLNPIANVWSVRVHDRDCPLLFSNGKGTSKKAALASALGAFCERLATKYFWADCYLGDDVANNKFVHDPNEQWFQTEPNGAWPNGVLNEALCDFYNPDGELNASTLIDVNTSNPERGICCIPHQCLRTGEVVNFPVNIISNLYASNGLAAGNNVAEARVHALSEIIERYVKFKVIAEGICLPAVPEALLERYSRIQASIEDIRTAGYTLRVQDASLGGVYPVMAISLLNPANQGVFVSFGAHPQCEVALERALTALFQGRGLEQADQAAEAGFDLDEVACPDNLAKHFSDSSGIVNWRFLSDKPDYDFYDWDKQAQTNNNAEAFKQLCDLIHATGNDIYLSEYKQIGVYTCRVLVPGLSEVYPPDKLVWENKNAGIRVRSAMLNPNKTPEECQQLIEDLEDLNLDDTHLVSSLIAMPSDADSIFSDLCVTELITLLALKNQDNERIQEGCEWLLHFRQLQPRRLKIYQCINTILQLDGMTNYASALEALYTHPILSDALALIDGEDVFPLASDWQQHKVLIKAYSKIMLLKSESANENTTIGTPPPF